MPSPDLQQYEYESEACGPESIERMAGPDASASARPGPGPHCGEHLDPNLDPNLDPGPGQAPSHGVRRLRPAASPAPRSWTPQPRAGDLRPRPEAAHVPAQFSAWGRGLRAGLAGALGALGNSIVRVARASGLGWPRPAAAADQLQVVSRLPVQGALVLIVEFESSRFLVATSARGQIALLQIDPRKAAAEVPARPGRGTREARIEKRGDSRPEGARPANRTPGRDAGRDAARAGRRAVGA